jgi:hypothetical protein
VLADSPLSAPYNNTSPDLFSTAIIKLPSAKLANSSPSKLHPMPLSCPVTLWLIALLSLLAPTTILALALELWSAGWTS